MDAIVSTQSKPAAPAAAMSAAIRVEGLTKRYRDVLAVNAIDFTVETRSFTALLGGNGAGKTTTLAMLLGLVRPSAGTIQILGKDFARAGKDVLARMNFQSPYADLPRRLTVRQNLTIYALLYGVKRAQDRIAEL